MNDNVDDDDSVRDEWEQGAVPPEVSRSGESELQKIRVQPRVSMFNQAEPELVDDQGGDDDVARLERSVEPGKERIKVAKVKFEKLEERPDDAEIQEEQWGGAAHIGWRSVLIGGVAVIVLIVALVVTRGFLRGDSSTEVGISPLVEIVEDQDPYKGSPEKWLRDRSGAIEVEALRVMKGYMDASDDQARSQWVRRPELFLKRAAQRAIPLRPLLAQRHEHSWDIGHTGETAYLIFTGRDADYLPFRAYFTQDGEQLKLDWTATTAWSEVSLQDIRVDARRRAGAVSDVQRVAGVVEAAQLSPSSKSSLPTKFQTKPVEVRCMIRKKNDFYAGPYNDQDYSAYMLLSSDKMHHMWGYAAKGSELDLKLKRILDHGSFVVSLKKDKWVTLRIRKAKKEALPSQIELVELLHPEWVTP